MPELKDLLEDSVISMANLSEVQTPTKQQSVVEVSESVETNSFEQKILREFEEAQNAAQVAQDKSADHGDKKQKAKPLSVDLRPS